MRRRIVIRLVMLAVISAALVMSLGANGEALAQDTATGRKVALVIGNSAYVHSPPLVNPRNDAHDIAAELRALGFQVISGFDLDKRAFEELVVQFSSALAGAKLGVFFYAGHGLQVDGVNYLVPVDAKLSTSAALDFEMVRLRLVQSLMEQATKTNVIFLDACRDNPLVKNLARAMGTRSTAIGRGLAQVDAGVGTLISYATQPGNVAFDGEGRNSPFSGALKRHLRDRGEDLTDILIKVRNDVMSATANKQVPWDQHALTARLFLADKAGGSDRPAGKRPPNSGQVAAATGSGTVGGRGTSEWATPSTPKAASSGALQAMVRNNCIPVGKRLERPVQVRSGSKLCSQDGKESAEIVKIFPRALIFKVKRRRTTCKPGDICRFNWRSAPYFRVEISRGVEVTARLIAAR